MPFGLSGALATFQLLMDQVIRSLPFTNACLGDIVIYSNSWDEHVDHLRIVFMRLSDAGLTTDKIQEMPVCYEGMYLFGTYNWTRKN